MKKFITILVSALALGTILGVSTSGTAQASASVPTNSWCQCTTFCSGGVCTTSCFGCN